MSSLPLSRPGILDRLVLPSWRRSDSRRRSITSETSPDDARARREFVQVMLTRNPDAFSSDLDVQTIMQLYPGRF
jgi:hypothetical protein